MPWVCPTAYHTKGLRLPSFAYPAIQTRWTAILGTAALLHMLNQQEWKNEDLRSAHCDSQVHTREKFRIKFLAVTAYGPLLFWPCLYLFVVVVVVVRQISYCFIIDIGCSWEVRAGLGWVFSSF